MMRPRFVPGVVIALASTGMATTPARAQRAPTPTELVALVLRGPVAPFEGSQRTEVFHAAGSSTAVVRVACDGHGRTRREFVSGAAAGTVSVRQDQSQWIRGADRQWRRLPDMPRDAKRADTAAALQRNYDLSIGKPLRLAGRSAVHLRITHRRSSDPSREVWIEPSTGIVLKDVLLAPDGRVRSVSEFTQIASRKPDASQFRVPVDAAAPALVGPSSFEPRASAGAAERDSGLPILLPKVVPIGYRIVMYGIMRTGSGRLTPAVRYSNGLAAFTIFQRGWGGGNGRGPGYGGPGRGRGWRGGRGQAGDGGRTASCVGRSDIQTSIIAVSAARSNYLLVGDLAEAELMRVARSLP